MKLDKIKKFRIILWLILVIFLLFILWQGIAPSGKISYSRDFNKNEESYFIRKLTPEERVEEIKNNSQKITGDPVYFFLRTPRKFNQAKLTIKYKNEKNLPLIEAGVLIDKDGWRHDLKPVENGFLDKLALVWDKIEQDGALLLIDPQADLKYTTINEFMSNPPNFERIAVFNHALPAEYLIPDYASTTQELIIDNSLRGSYEFYTYLKDEDLSYLFVFSNLKEETEETANLHLYYLGQVIDSKIININEQTEYLLILANLPEGAYKIELKASDSIITESIKTKQNKISFKNKIWLYESKKDNLEIFTDSRELRFQTIAPESLQNVLINNDELKIAETYRQYSFKTATGSSLIKPEKAGIILAGEGFFSFDKQSLFNPEPRRADINLDLTNTNIQYALAGYTKPGEEGGWKIAEIDFDLSKAFREKGAYRFIISIPGLRADDDLDEWIEIGDIKIDLSGKSLREKVRDFRVGK